MSASLNVKVGADVSAMTSGLAAGERGYATFRERVGSISEGVSKHLEGQSRTWKKWSRELTNTSRGVTEGLGAVVASSGTLSDSLKLTGHTAELFSGAAGIGSIGLTLATGGPVLAGIGALVAVLALTARGAEEAKKQMDAFHDAVKDASNADLASQRAALEHDLAGAQSKMANLRRTNVVTETPIEHGMVVKVGTNDSAILQTEAAITDLQTRLAAVNDELANTKDTAKRFADDVGTVTKRLQQMSKEGGDASGVLRAARSEMAQVDAQLAKLGGSTSEEAVKLHDMRDALAAAIALFSPTKAYADQIGTLTSAMAAQNKNGWKPTADLMRQTALAIGDLDARISKFTDKTSAAAVALLNLRAGLVAANGGVDLFRPTRLPGVSLIPSSLNPIVQADPSAPYKHFPASDPSQRTFRPFTLPNGSVVGGGGLTVTLNPKPLYDLNQKTDRVHDAIESGLHELPGSLSLALAPLIGSLVGSGPGAQVGAGLIGAVGQAAGSGLSKTMGSIGQAVIPVIGGVVGSLIGGAIGGLFGHHKKSIDDNTTALASSTAAIQHLDETITNMPPGVKVESYRYVSSVPVPTSIQTRPRSGPGGTTVGPQANRVPTITLTGDVHVHGVTDLQSLVRKIGDAVLDAANRGGTTTLLTAIG